MDPFVELSTDALSAAPGGQTRVDVRIRNLSTIVEGFRIDVVGEPAAWATVEPAEVSIYPQDEGHAEVVFDPPAGGSARAGSFPFGVRVVSLVDPSTSAVAEGDLEVSGVSSLTASMTPVASRGRWSGRHTVEIANWGNGPCRLQLQATDPDEQLGFLVKPDVLDVPVGATATARLRVRTRKPVLRGVPMRHPFRIATVPADGQVATGPPLPYDPTRPGADGAFNQVPIISRNVAMVGLLAVVLLGVGLWKSLSQPDNKPGASNGGLAPEAPAEFAVASGAPGEVLFTWRPADGVDAYVGYEVEEGTVGGGELVFEASGEEGRKTVKEVEGRRHCFELEAQREGVPSARSPQQCVDVQPAGGTDGTGGTGGTGGTDGTDTSDGTSPTTEVAMSPPESPWMAVLGSGQNDDPGGLATAEALLSELEAAGVAGVAMFDTAEHPDVFPAATKAHVIYVPFETEGDAQTFCRSSTGSDGTIRVSEVVVQRCFVQDVG